MSTRFIVSMVVTGLALTAAAAPAAADLTTARALYANASYEEALTELNGLEASADPEQVEQVRALCLLALGRTEDAEQSLQRIVTQKPLYKLAESEVSPRLVAMFDEVRREALPAAARTLYTKAKASYDAKDFKSASGQFKEMLAIANDPDVAEEDSTLDELKQLGEGFLALSDAAIAAAAKPAPPVVPPPAATPPARAASAAPALPAVYTADDAEVRPPVAVVQTLPKWVPPSGNLARATFAGRLEIVINEQGQVEMSSLVTPISVYYDPELLNATKRWRYQPATKDGKPVKFRKSLDIVLRPGGDEEE
jgi:tetratricopeptide (TPR) repeat protein